MAEDSVTRTQSRYDKLMTDAASNSGPLAKLYNNKFATKFLQYPLNLESVEQDHWIRFDIKKIQGVGVKTDESRGHESVAPSGEKKTFLQRVTTGTAEKLGDLRDFAQKTAISQARRQATSAANSLPPALAGIGKAFINGQGKTQSLGSIMLYAPQGRTESMAAEWTPEEAGQLGAVAGKVGAGATSDAIDAALATVLPGGKEALIKLGAAAAGNQTLAAIVHRKEGHVVNPHLEMFFKGVNMREFTFEFKMAPRNAPEAKAVADIVRLFKFASTPGLTGALGFYLDYPEVFDISFSNQDQTHKIAQSALKSISVSYGAEGINTTFYDGYPLETMLSLTFIELEIMTKTKIEQGY